MTPERKVTIGAGIGAFTAMLVWALNTYVNAAIPAEMAVTAGTALTFVGQYFIPNPSS